MGRVPVLDFGLCTDCGGCLDLCPGVFVRHPSGYIEVKDLEAYPEDCVDEAIRCCPQQCISWEEGDDD